MTDPNAPHLHGWRADLAHNTGGTGISGYLAAWLTAPGFRIVRRWRLAQRLYLRGGITRIAARLLQRKNHLYGCYISLEASIGPGLALPHATAIVVGDGSVIGRDVMLFQNVTLGRRKSSLHACPTIGDGVVVYCGATILGGVAIGARAQIGAHALVVTDLPDGAIVKAAPASRERG